MNYETIQLGKERIYIDSQFEKQKHSCVSGTVVKNPDKVRWEWTDKGGKVTVSFKEPETQVGDEVLFHYLDYPQALSAGNLVKDGDTFESAILAAINYQKLYIAVRDGEVVALNGTIVVEPYTEDVIKSKLLFLPQQLQNKPTTKCGIVRYCAAPLRYEKDYDFIKPGVTVFFAEYDSVPLQYDMHQIIDKGKTLYRMNHEHIIAGLA